MYYIINFYLYSILGYFLETIYSLISNNDFESGILYGPWTPIYGIGVIIIILLSKTIFKSMHKNRFIETIVVFISVTIILTLLEYLAGITIEKIFNIVFWDYSNQKYNIGKYISLSMSMIWGIGSVLFIYLIKPISDKIINKIPNFIIYLISFIFIFDVVYTIISKI